ncbi:ribosome small subunit-dependent GTPase A [Collinsella sp. zg1085]|uniref:ribosome small subunit-dependent GTPase A n=1 Tax=Collinsella sp. zg1085 TaxID=2844380 RepID=UPI00209AD12E|nr:ribosome small subunit-dependent GTPase A [Collinsella sp. zg1085]
MGKQRREQRKNKHGHALQAVPTDLSVSHDALPAIDSFIDVPVFADLSCSDEQHAAFQRVVETAALIDAVQASYIRLGYVARLDRGFPLVVSDTAMLRAEHAVHFAKKQEQHLLPTIGDWVAVRVDPKHDKGVIEAVLPRTTSFERWRGKNRGERQVLAANVHTILVVIPLGGSRDSAGFRYNRIARALVLSRDCGAKPVIVFTKGDRACDAEREQACSEARIIAGDDVRIVMTSSKQQEGLEELRACIKPGQLSMILGESGAGKSTLINALLGHETLKTSDVRERDDMGRHTTVARMMCKIPGNAGVLVDAPGLRSLPLVGHERGLAQSFADIARLAQSCRFRDCTHRHEPGCEVLAAISCGELHPERFEAFSLLAEEMRVSAQSLDPDIKLS